MGEKCVVFSRGGWVLRPILYTHLKDARGARTPPFCRKKWSPEEDCVRFVVWLYALQIRMIWMRSSARAG